MLWLYVFAVCVVTPYMVKGEEEDKCHPNPCQNDGECSVSRYRDQGFFCWCPGQHWGNRCEKESPCKHGNPCQNGGRCRTATWSDEGFYCRCVRGFYGKNCENVSPCNTGNPCRNGGSCFPSSFNYNIGYYCMCPRDYYGQNCTKKNPCLEGDICNGGECSMSQYIPDGYRCECPDGKGGKQCQFQDPCKPNNPCQNSGNCSSYLSSDGFRMYCQCPRTHWGDRCEKESPCKDEMCQNGGKCLGGMFPYCNCATGFRGGHCERKYCPLTVEKCTSYKDRFLYQGKGKGGVGGASSSAEQCLARMNQEHQKMVSCVQNTTAEIIKLRSCDCQTTDVFHIGVHASYGQDLQAIVYCYVIRPEALHHLSCPQRTVSCIETAKKTFSLFRLSNCTAEALAAKRELKQCVDDYDAGRLTASGDCAPLQKLFNAVSPLIKIAEKLMCTSCDHTKVQDCLFVMKDGRIHHHMSVCELIEKYESVKKCVADKLNADASCASLTDEALASAQVLFQHVKNQQEKHCQALEEFHETRVKEWGCPETED